MAPGGDGGRMEGQGSNCRRSTREGFLRMGFGLGILIVRKFIGGCIQGTDFNKGKVGRISKKCSRICLGFGWI